MANLLTPPGLVPRHKYISSPVGRSSCAATDPMPIHPGARIQTERGVRGLQLDEFCRGLGYSKLDAAQVSHPMASRTTPIFHWEFLSTALSGCPAEVVNPVLPSGSPLSTKNIQTDDVSEPPSFSWSPPDLQKGGKWFLQRISNLREACSQYHNKDELFDDGLSRLDRHRMNYNSDGPAPKWLQLLWWEFPSEHWDELRDGFRQNFLISPPESLTPNAAMDESGLAAAAAFVDELLDLGVIRSIEEGMKIVANAHLFVVPKDGQHGEWRIIADMKKGG